MSGRADGALQGATGVLSSLTRPMIVATVIADGALAGCLVGFHTQCSIDPARYLVCVSRANHTWRVVRRADALAVHFLAHDDMGLAHLFGEATGDAVDKFARCEWAPGPLGLPILSHHGSWLAGPIVSRHTAGDHHAIIIDAVHGGSRPPGAPLQSTEVLHFRPGHPA